MKDIKGKWLRRNNLKVLNATKKYLLCTLSDFHLILFIIGNQNWNSETVPILQKCLVLRIIFQGFYILLSDEFIPI